MIIIGYYNLENVIFKQVKSALFITSFYIVSLIITSVSKGKNEGKKKLQYQITNNEKVIELRDMLKF